jgi:hypothetical protein
MKSWEKSVNVNVNFVNPENYCKLILNKIVCFTVVKVGIAINEKFKIRIKIIIITIIIIFIWLWYYIFWHFDYLYKFYIYNDKNKSILKNLLHLNFSFNGKYIIYF